MAGRNYNQAFHCIHKHTNNSATHLFETLEKLYREPPSNGVDSGTREELLRGQREVQAIEGHAGEIISKLDDDDVRVKEKVREIGDEARSIRQDIQKTGIPFKANVDVNPDSTETVENALKRIEELQRDVDQFATQFEQEQVNCARCEKDLQQVVDSVGGELKETFLNDDNESKDSTDKLVRPGLRRNQFEDDSDELIPVDLLGGNNMVNTSDIQALTVGAFGSKTLEEVSEIVEREVLPGTQVGPLSASNMINLGVGLGVPVLEIMDGTVTRSLGSDNALAAIAGSLNLLANETGDLLASTAGLGTSSLSARQATVSQTSGGTEPENTGGSASGLNVGSGGGDTPSNMSGLTV